MTDAASRGSRWIPAGLVLGGLALHLPGLGRPFGVHEISAGNYFGVFARNFDRLGFAALRGTPIGPVVFGSADDPGIVPYLSHPPGAFWLLGLTDTTEASLRLTTALGHIAAALLTFTLFRRLLGIGPAACAGAATLLFPVLAFFAQVSYETLVLPLGLLLLLASERAAARTGAARRRWRVVVAAAALLGPWLDWQFLFFCAGLAVLAAGPPVAMLRRLWLPAACAAVSLAAVLAWRAWASARWTGASSAATGEGGGIAVLLERTVGARPPVLAFAGGLGERAIECFSTPVLLLALAGMVPLARTLPRLAAALAVVGLLNAALFPVHTMTHTLYLAYLAPLLAGALGAAVRGRGRLGAAAAAVALLAAGWATLADRAQAATPFFRDLGRVLTAAAHDGTQRYAVLFDLPYCYGYYVDSPLVAVQRVDDPALLAGWRAPAVLARAGVDGIRYLRGRWEGEPGKPPLFAAPPALDAWLAAFPSLPLPQLTGTLSIPPDDPALALLLPAFGARALRLADARLYTIGP